MGQRLRELRLAKGLTQKQLAEHLGITQKAYCFYELGEREPSVSTIIKLCDFFDISADYLIGRTDY